MKKIDGLIIDSDSTTAKAAVFEQDINLGDDVLIESSDISAAGKVVNVNQLYINDFLDRYALTEVQRKEIQMIAKSKNEDTAVTVITLSKKGDAKELNVVDESTDYSEIKLYTDGGSRGNPGPSATGVALLTMDDQLIKTDGTYLGITTNNQAEYKAVLEGLELAYELGAKKVHVLMDSLLVVNQMNGIFKIKNPDLMVINQLIREKITIFDSVTFKHVPRALNKLADAAVNGVLDNQ